jgi:hypothetical protein
MKKTWIAGPVLALAAVLSLPLHSFAGGLTVHGGKIESSVEPGKSYSYNMRVENTSDEPMNIAIEVAGYGTSGTSDFIPLDPAKDTSSSSAREMIAVAPASFSLTPGSAQDIVAQARMPSGLPDGGKYAIIFIHTVPAGGAVSTVKAVAARVMLTNAGSALNETSAVSGLKWNPQSPLDVAFTLSNAGNHHFKPHIAASLTSSGTVVAKASLDAQWPLVPGYGRDFSLRLEPTAPLPPGEYQSRITVTNDAGAMVCERVENVVIAAASADTEAAGAPGAAPRSNDPAVATTTPTLATAQSYPAGEQHQQPAVESGPETKGDRGTNWLLWTGAALGVLVVAGLAYTLGRRKATAGE